MLNCIIVMMGVKLGMNVDRMFSLFICCSVCLGLLCFSNRLRKIWFVFLLLCILLLIKCRFVVKSCIVFGCRSVFVCSFFLKMCSMLSLFEKNVVLLVIVRWFCLIVQGGWVWWWCVNRCCSIGLVLVWLVFSDVRKMWVNLLMWVVWWKQFCIKILILWCLVVLW